MKSVLQLTCDINSCCFFGQALQCFQEAATEVEKEEFLMKLAGGEYEEATPSPRLQYYNKVEEDESFQVVSR